MKRTSGALALMIGLLGMGCGDSEGSEATQAEAPPTAPSAEDPPSTAHGEGAEEGHPTTGWCRGHQVPESMCTICHPNLVAQFQASGDWCEEHSLPESVCPQCNPTPAEAEEGAAAEEPGES